MYNSRGEIETMKIKKRNIKPTAHVLCSPQRAVLHVLVIPNRRYNVRHVDFVLIIDRRHRFLFGRLHPAELFVLAVHFRFDDVVF